jgi:MFS superfamily sulfate permease-like transporter
MFCASFAMLVLSDMETLKKIFWNKPESRLGVGILVGIAIGIGMDNIGAGIAIGVAIGVAMYTTKKKTEKESSVDENEVQINKDNV